MELTEREWKAWDDIKEWERKLYLGESNDFTNFYDKWLDIAINQLPKDTRDSFFSKLDNWLFHLHAFIQNSGTQQESHQQILGSARVFDETIQQIEDLKHLSFDQLTYIADHQIAKHRLASLAQGSLTGTGNSFFISADLIAMAVINLKVIQLIAMSFGFESNTPLEMMLSLKVFYTATLPKRYQKYGWEMLMEEVKDFESSYFYVGNENFTDEKWIEQPAKQLAKSLFFLYNRKKLFHRFPIVGIAIGASMNYKLTRQVTEFAEKFYQLRFLLTKKGDLS